MAVIDARAVSKRFLLRHNASAELKVRFLGFLHPEKRQSVEEFWALRNVSLAIEPGEAVGLIGRNGSGKSTFLKLIAGIHGPTSGQLLVARGARISSMIELGVGFHPELTGRENVFLSASIHGLTRADIERIYQDVVEYSGLEHFIDVPIKNYSSGMHIRLGFAIAANLDPDILLLDEIFAVGDADFQQRCVGTIQRFMEEGKTIIFVSHAPAAIRAICRRVAVLDQGGLAFDGGLEEGLSFYEASLARRSATTETRTVTDAELDSEPHRLRLSGHWRETGLWQFELLRKLGLAPRDRVLEVGCGTLAAAIHLIPFLDDDGYWGIERDRTILESALRIELPRAGIDPGRGQFLVDEAFDLGGVPGLFDVAFAASLFGRLSFNSVARCIASVVRKLQPSGRFYATWFENPDSANFEPIVHADGTISFPDREPYHYPLDLIALVCTAVGAVVERVPDIAHPGGESVCVISRQSGHD